MCIVFSSSWSRVKQAEELDDWQFMAPGSPVGPYKGNCGQMCSATALLKGVNYAVLF